MSSPFVILSPFISLNTSNLKLIPFHYSCLFSIYLSSNNCFIISNCAGIPDHGEQSTAVFFCKQHWRLFFILR